uniref:Uncharacterized protein n=1 Tax=Panagrellus redivivus TaxID=6233 RepID=A0A7E4V4B9_PANRE
MSAGLISSRRILEDPDNTWSAVEVPPFHHSTLNGYACHDGIVVGQLEALIPFVQRQKGSDFSCIPSLASSKHVPTNLARHGFGNMANVEKRNLRPMRTTLKAGGAGLLFRRCPVQVGEQRRL